MVPPLGVQLTTPVTLVTYCLGHSHVLVELMEIGHILILSVKVGYISLAKATDLIILPSITSD